MNISPLTLLIVLSGICFTTNAQLFLRGKAAIGNSVSQVSLFPFKSCSGADFGIEFQNSDSSFVFGTKASYFFLQPEFNHFDQYRQWHWGIYFGKNPIPSLRKLRFSAGLFRAKSKFTIRNDFFPSGVQNTGPSFFSQWGFETSTEYDLLKNLKIDLSFDRILPRRYAPLNKNSFFLVGIVYVVDVL